MAGDRVTGMLKNTVPTPTDVIWFCSTTISTAKPAAASAHASRLAGRAHCETARKTQLKSLTRMATAYPPCPVGLAQTSQDLTTSQWCQFEIFNLAPETFHGLGKKL